MKATGLVSLVLGLSGLAALCMSAIDNSPKAVDAEQLASIWGGRVVWQDPVPGEQDPEPVEIRKCQTGNNKCKDVYNAYSPCFGKTWMQDSACPTTQTCIPATKKCTHNALLKECIGVIVEECDPTAVRIDCGTVKKADIGACSVAGTINPNGGFICRTIAGQCRTVGGPTDIPCLPTAECQ